MKALKTVASLILALCMLLICPACTPIISDDSNELAADGGTESSPPVLVMATDASFPPYEYTQDQGIVGIDIEIANKIAAKLGVELQVKNMAFTDIIAAVQNKEADIGMAALTADKTRLAFVNFSASYVTSRQVIIVDKDSDIAAPADLAGKKIGVRQGTAGSIYCTEEFGEAAVTSYSSGTAAVQALLQKQIDAVVLDSGPAKALVQISENLQVLDTEYKIDDFAIAINQDSTSLLEKINSALAELKASGEIQAIVDQYIKAD